MDIASDPQIGTIELGSPTSTDTIKETSREPPTKLKSTWHSDMHNDDKLKIQQATAYDGILPVAAADRFRQLELENKILHARLLELEEKQSQQRMTFMPYESATWTMTPPPCLEIGDMDKQTQAVLTVIPRRKARGNAGQPCARNRRMAPVCITLEVLHKMSSLSLAAASDCLGITTAMKKSCRKLGVTRWPYHPHKAASADGSQEHGARAFQGQEHDWDSSNSSPTRTSSCDSGPVSRAPSTDISRSPSTDISRAPSTDTDVVDLDFHAAPTLVQHDQMCDSDVRHVESAAMPQCSLSFESAAHGNETCNEAHLPRPFAEGSRESHPLEDLGASFKSSFKGMSVRLWSERRRSSVVIISRRGSFAAGVEPLGSLTLQLDDGADGHQTFEGDLLGFHWLEDGNGSLDMRDT